MSTPGDLLGALSRRLGNGGDRPAGTRTYRGRSIEELIPRIQRDLGPDAIIVRRREGLSGGFMGFFQHAFVEVEAMPGGPRVDTYDDEHAAQPGEHPAAPAQPALGQPAAGQPVAPGAPPPAGPMAASAQPSALGRQAAFVQPPPQVPYPYGGPAAQQPQPAPGFAPALHAHAAAPAQSESAYVTPHLAALARAQRPRAYEREPQVPRPAPPRDPAWSAGPRPVPDLPAAAQWGPPPAPVERRIVAPGSQARARAGVARRLQRSGVSEELAQELIAGAAAHALALAPRAGLVQAVRTTIAQRIPVAPPLPATGAAIVLVGAGGSGKTTCCAALLGAYRSGSSLPASYATLTRSEESNELQVILSPHIMTPTAAHTPRALRAMRRSREEGLAVIDTPRVSPADRAGIRELARLLADLEPERVVVALPATLGATAAAQLLTALRPLGANALAVTHGDETDQMGVAVEVACRFALAPEYLLERGRGGGWRLGQLDPAGLAARLLQ